MGATSCSRWRRWRCPASCSAASWTGSRGCVRRTWPHADARWARWGEPGVEMRPECVHGVLKSSRKSLGEVPEARGGRQEGVLPRREQKTLAFEATRAVSRLRDGAGPPFIWEMSDKVDHEEVGHMSVYSSGRQFRASAT